MTTAPRTVRGIRDSIPQGYIIGRSSSGSGAPELISLKDLASQLSKTAAVIPAPGSVPTVSSGPKKLFMGITRPGNGADLTEDTLFNFAIPASTLLNIGDSLLVKCFFSFANTATNKAALLRFGNSATPTSNPALSGAAAASRTNVNLFTEVHIIRTGASTQVAHYAEHVASGATFGTPSSVVKVNSPFTATDTAIIFLSATASNSVATANGVICEELSIEYWPAPA